MKVLLYNKVVADADAVVSTLLRSTTRNTTKSTSKRNVVADAAVVPEDIKNETLRKIDDIVDKALRLRDDKDKSEVIDPYLIDCIKGLRNLKQTYSLCVQTCARLDTIIGKINRNITVILESSSDLDE